MSPCRLSDTLRRANCWCVASGARRCGDGGDGQPTAAATADDDDDDDGDDDDDDDDDDDGRCGE